MPKFLEPSKEWIRWAEEHRCAICNALPTRIDSKMIDEFRTPTHRRGVAHRDRFSLPRLDRGTEYRYLASVECANGHVMSGIHVKFKEEKGG